jgi:hypothetical protein
MTRIAPQDIRTWYADAERRLGRPIAPISGAWSRDLHDGSLGLCPLGAALAAATGEVPTGWQGDLLQKLEEATGLDVMYADGFSLGWDGEKAPARRDYCEEEYADVLWGWEDGQAARRAIFTDRETP